MLDRVTWPEQHGLVVVRHYPQVFRAAAEWLGRQAGSDAERQAVSILSSTVKAPGSEDSDLCLDLDGYGDPAVTEAVGRALKHVQGR